MAWQGKVRRGRQGQLGQGQVSLGLSWGAWQGRQDEVCLGVAGLGVVPYIDFAARRHLGLAVHDQDFDRGIGQVLLQDTLDPVPSQTAIAAA